MDTCRHLATSRLVTPSWNHATACALSKLLNFRRGGIVRCGQLLVERLLIKPSKWQHFTHKQQCLHVHNGFFPSGFYNVFRQNGPKQGPFSQVSAFPFAPKLSSRESRAIFAQTQHRQLTAEQEFITIWLGWDSNNSSELSLQRTCFPIVILNFCA